MIHTLAVLMGAGTEPQQNLIANALRLLPADDRFAGHLCGGSLPVEDALDEVLWTDPPMANYAVHYPRCDVRYEGALLKAGDPVVVSLAAANTDPALQNDQRTGSRAHLAWSAGPHNCPAQSEARLIASVAVEKLHDRLPNVELAVPAAALEWRPGPFHRALAALRVTFPPAPVVGAPAEPPARRGRTAAVPPPGRRSPPARRAAGPGCCPDGAASSGDADEDPPGPTDGGRLSASRTWGVRQGGVRPPPARRSPPARGAAGPG